MNERVNYFLGCFFWLTLFMLTDCVLLISEKSPFHSVGSELLLQLVSVFRNSTWHAVQIAPVRYAGSRLTSRFDFINCGLIFHVWHDAHVCAYICVLYLKFTWFNSGDYCSAKWMRGLLNMKGFLEMFWCTHCMGCCCCCCCFWCVSVSSAGFSPKNLIFFKGSYYI